MDGYKRNYIVINRQRLLSILCFVAVGAIIGLTRYSESKIYVKVTNATNFTLNPELYSLQLIRVRDFLNICLECDGSPRSDKVMSFTIFGDSTNQDTKDRFFEPLKLTLSSVGNLYPGWEVRIYYHPNIQHVVAGLSNVRLCNVMALPFAGTDLPASHIDLSWINPRVWRFLPLLDDYVSVFLSRDSDSIILKREVSAVEEWLNFNRSFHVMRDHPQHGAAILAGMWGARLDKRRKEIREAAVDMVLSSQDDLKSTDQRQLEYRIWPIAKSDSVVHDSYFCKNHRLRSRDITLPFPTRRENYTFVGNVVNMSEYLFEECPEECRPVEHKEWYFC